MTETESPVTPTLINLHRKSRMLEVGFSDGSEFNYPCEYLRVFAPSDTAQTDAAPVHGKRGDGWNEAFADDRVQVTVNKHFAELFTLVEDGDEAALVPRTR